MKLKLSISMDNETVAKIEEAIKDGKFRNKSHIVEYAVNSMLKSRGQNE